LEGYQVKEDKPKIVGYTRGKSGLSKRTTETAAKSRSTEKETPKTKKKGARVDRQFGKRLDKKTLRGQIRPRGRRF